MTSLADLHAARGDLERLPEQCRRELDPDGPALAKVARDVVQTQPGVQRISRR
jgi:hypothetical protein